MEIVWRRDALRAPLRRFLLILPNGHHGPKAGRACSARNTSGARAGYPHSNANDSPPAHFPFHAPTTGLLPTSPSFRYQTQT